MSTFEKDLSNLLNRHSKDSEVNTPDYILAEFLLEVIKHFGNTTEKRDRWLGRRRMYEGKDFTHGLAITQAHSDIIAGVCKDLQVTHAKAGKELIDLAIMVLVMLPEPADVTATDARFNEAMLLLRSDANVMELSRSVRRMWEAGKEPRTA